MFSAFLIFDILDDFRDLNFEILENVVYFQTSSILKVLNPLAFWSLQFENLRLFSCLKIKETKLPKLVKLLKHSKVFGIYLFC